MKKIVAFALSGMMVLGAGMSVYAADTAAESEATAAAGEEEGLGSLVGGLLGSLGSEDGSVEDLLTSLGADEGELNDLMGLLGEGGEGLSSLVDEGTKGVESLVNGVLGGLSGDGEGFSLDEESLKGIAEVIGNEMGISLSEEDIAGITAALSDPETLNEMISGFFAEGGMLATILDAISSEDYAIASVIQSMKDPEGGYDYEKILKALEGAQETDNGLLIDGTEISGEELAAVANEVMGMFGVSGAAETEAAS